MFKSSAALLEPDPRYRDLVFHSGETGELRRMRMEDLRNLVTGIELNECVPATIREHRGFL
jgi:hypothetical protein